MGGCGGGSAGAGERYIPPFHWEPYQSSSSSYGGKQADSTTKYAEKLASRLPGIGSILSSRQRRSRSSFPKLAPHHLDSGAGASAGTGSSSSDSEPDADTSRGEGGNRVAGAVQVVPSAPALEPPSAAELAILARACSLYPFSRCPGAAEAAAFRKQLWA